MMRLHQALIKLVTDLSKLSSLTLLFLSPDPSLLKLIVIDVSPVSNYSSSEPSLHLPTRKEPLNLTMKDENSHTCQYEDTVRKKQQQHIQQLVAFIDERAAHYYRSRPTPIQDPYPKVD